MIRSASATGPPLLLRLFTILIAYSDSLFSANAGKISPFTPKASAARYWRKWVSNDLPKPAFLLDKASPLTAADYAAFYKLLDHDRNSLSAHLPEFCAKANLLCFPDLAPSLEKHSSGDSFATYLNKNFTNYGTDGAGGLNSFTKYSEQDNVVVDTFRRYSRGAAGHDDKFTAYGTGSNVVDQSFNTYGTSTAGGVGKFSNYNTEVNVPNLRFTSYSDSATGRKQSFTEYTSEANSGDQRFTSYGKNGNSAANEFKSYGKASNVMGSTFNNYGEKGLGPKDTFSTYGNDSNVPQNNFKNYGAGALNPVESFKSYREGSNVGDDSFQSYGKKSDTAEVDFANYGQSFNEGTDKFTGYGKDAKGQTVDFKIYGVNNTFKDYAKEGVTFGSYSNVSSPSASLTAATAGKKAGKWVVEPGKFFREKMLKRGTIMPMPDIRDKMPERSFLPRPIVSKLPFSTSHLKEMKLIFHAGEGSSIEGMLTDSLKECERAPSPGEVKRCVASIEDMIDFATSVLGKNAAVRTTESTVGSKGNIVIGKVKGINGGRVTKSVSCHQSLYPYLLYYCHSVPKVRVYEADLLDPKSGAKINHGVAICHIDTSSWSSGHGAFIALGSGPGKIEVCHWIFENDMTWTMAD